MPKAGTKRRSNRSRWRHTLYARAWLFLLLGGGALVGALAAMSGRLVDASVDRLLDERLDLARSVGGLVERRILGELEHLTHRAAQYLVPGHEAELRAALAQEYPLTVFREGALALDPSGAPLVALPTGPRQFEQVLDLRALAERAQTLGRPVISPLVHLPVGDRPVVVALQTVYDASGAICGSIGGVVQPTATDLLRDVADIRGAAVTDLELVDANGIVIASTARRGLYQSGDHESVLVDAIERRRDFKGRCHSCHEQGDQQPADTHVMSFAPLPTLPLGLAVYQPEDAALAPAFDLRRKLMMIIAVVAIFVVFLGFAIHSVVRPVVRLRRAVDRLEAGTDGRLPAFGRDEVGALARSLEHWRGRMMEAMAALDDSRRAASAQARAVRCHLHALEEIAASGGGGELDEVLSAGLDHLLATTGRTCGALRLTWADERHECSLAMSPADMTALLGAAQSLPRPAERSASDTGHTVHCVTVTRAVGAAEPHIIAHLYSPLGAHLVAALTGGDAMLQIPEQRIHSLMFQVCMTSTAHILRGREALVQQQQERYLRGVLDAQEEERARIARDLHDTIAQELAALRLELERFALHLQDPAQRAALDGLEARAAGALRTTRAILLDLRLTVLDSMGFVSTLQWHLERLGREYGIRGALSIDGDERPLGYYLAVALLRIFQECLNNVIQHAHAEQVFVTLAFEPTQVSLIVEDDGAGFAEAELAPESGGEHGLGILGMRERTRLLGGTLTISSRPGEGTAVAVTVPSDGIEDAAAAAHQEEQP